MVDSPDSTLERLLQVHGVVNWDLLLIGDGSGSGAMQPCGWAVALIDRVTAIRRLLVGGLNMGSISVAEMLPYVLAMDHFDSTIRGAVHRKSLTHAFSMDVHIFTDSQYTANAGRQVSSRGKHGALWAGIGYLERSGYNINWHWIQDGRNNPFLIHKLMDEIASEGRNRMKGIEQTSELYELLP